MIAKQPSTIGEHGKRRWVYPVEVSGRYTRLRNLVAVVLALIFYLAPWIRVSGDGTDVPLIRLSFLSGHFVLFGQTILIYEFYRFVYLALFLAIILFLSSALYGRIWCGYACPQSIFIDRLLRLIEHVVQGSATHRKSLEGKPLTLSVLLRKVVTQIIFVAVCFSFAWTLVAIFTGTEKLLAMEDPVSMGAIALITGLAWFDGAYWREQFCIIVCPYARFQSVMQDAGTRQIGYDRVRGEPRSRSRKDSAAKGDCIDCGLCVRVCPTGIDIRDGVNQLECVSCKKCADACDGVMEKIGKPVGLIRVDTETRLTSRLENGNLPPKVPLVRVRTALYSLVAIALFSYGTYAFVNHEPLIVRLVPTTRDPFVQDGNVLKNLFTIKVGNQSSGARSYELSVVDPAGVVLRSPSLVPRVAQGAERSIPVLLEFSETPGLAEQIVTLAVKEIEGDGAVLIKRRLLAPDPSGEPDF